MPRLSPVRALIVAVLALAGAGVEQPAVASPPAAARLPSTFVGVNGNDPLFGPPVDLAHEFHLMVAAGVESFRTAFDWSAAQPYKSESQVPADERSQFQLVGGVPTRFSAIDPIVTLSATLRMTLLPVVLYTPGWAAKHPGNTLSDPSSPRPYAAFLTALIKRYGPHGSFWSSRPNLRPLPIRAWQIWNEPDISYFWPDRPWVAPYVKLLRSAHAAIKQADPGAKVVLAGLTNYSWHDLASIYAIHGARSLFDAVAVHGYTKYPSGVVTILQYNRSVMDQHGDAKKPLMATEWSFPSARPNGGNQPWDTTESGQAHDVATVIHLLAKNAHSLHLTAFYYYTWIGDEDHGAYEFDFAGLRRLVGGKVTSKPALSSFRTAALAIEGCRSKGSTAQSCH